MAAVLARTMQHLVSLSIGMITRRRGAAFPEFPGDEGAGEVWPWWAVRRLPSDRGGSKATTTGKPHNGSGPPRPVHPDRLWS